MQNSNSKITMNTIYKGFQNIKYKEQWLLYFLLNILFIWKYMSRTSYSPLIGMAVTRLWAPIAPAIYLTKSFFKISHGRKILILAIILLVMFFFFAPYIFWDTDNWIFFHHNPYMSETSTGNGWILLIMIVIALFLAFRYQTFNQYSRYTSCFFTLFFITSLLYNHIAYNSDVSFFEDADFDISYLSLMLPYCLFLISQYRPIDVTEK